MPKQNAYYESICDEIRKIKFKYWTPPEEASESSASPKPESEYITVGFYKGDIKTTYERNGRSVSCIAFPKNSKYASYVWFFPSEWIKENKNNSEKRWVSIKSTNNVIIIKSEKASDGKYVRTGEKEITSLELKEAMKRIKKN